MKKNFKLVLALVLSIMMIMGSVAALADTPTGSITINPSTTVALKDKTLKAYKILDATYNGDAVAYTIPAAMSSFYADYFKQEADAGAGIEAKTVAELAAAANQTVDQYVVTRINNLTPAQLKDFDYAVLAAAKSASVTGKAGAYDATNKNYKIEGLDAGYYVIEDEGAATPLSALMLDTVKDADVQITLKAADETKKEILTAGELQNKKADELGLGRDVDFKITQKIPDTTGYDYFYYLINDTLSAGLTFNPGSVIVKVGGTVLTEGTDYYLYYVGDTHSTDATFMGGKTFIVAFNDIVSDIANAEKPTFVSGADVEVTYNATVNGNAITGVNPNTNKVTVEYSNNPDKDGRGDYENHPGYPANRTDHPMGEGPEKWTDTYTTKITILKIDGTTKNPLPGVEFTLTGSSKDATFKAWEVFEAASDGTYYLLKDGTYTTTAPRTAPTLEETTGDSGWVEDSTYNESDARVVGGKTYRPYKPAEDSGTTHYIIVEANDTDYTSTTTKYKKVTKTADNSETYTVTRTGITAGANASIDFSQLGAGTYTLSETGVLPGYNKIPDITFEVTCTLPEAEAVIAGTEKATWAINVTSGNATFTEGTGDNLGKFTITLENNKGVELPHTGGIGTTIFYIGGSVLVLAAAILLITKRRMSSND